VFAGGWPDQPRVGMAGNLTDFIQKHNQ